jgi:hypothetical protein
VLASAAITGEALTPTLLLSALMVAGGIGPDYAAVSAGRP